MHYKYCPQCGLKLSEKEAGDDGLVPYCTECGKYWFDSFASCIIVMVLNEYEEVALLKQSYISDRYWCYVAGYIKPGESAEETAVREVSEEIGLTVDRLEYEGTHWFPRGDQLMHAYYGHVKKAEMTLSQEVDEAKWVKLSEAEDYLFPDIPGSTSRLLYNKLMNNKKQGNR